MAPAFDTAMASSGVVFLAPCGASKIGYFRANSAISAFERWVGIGTAVGLGEAADLGTELNANDAPASSGGRPDELASRVLAHNRLHPSQISIAPNFLTKI